MHHILRNSIPVFDTLVDELHQEAARLPATPSTACATTAIEAIWLTADDRARTAHPPQQNTAYLDAIVDGGEPLLNGLATDEDSVRRDLGLVAGLSTEQVSLLRRQFARRNHPDLYPPPLRQLATLRMTIANALCDAYR